jgi:hypothetical protein
VLVDEFEFLPSTPAAPQTAVIAPTPPPIESDPIASILAPKSGPSSSPAPIGSGPLRRAASDDAEGALAGIAGPGRDLRIKGSAILRYRARSAAASLDNTPRPSPTGSVASSRSMTPQLSFDDLEQDDQGTSGSAASDMGPVCESPVTMMLNDTPDRRGSTSATVGLRKEEHLGGGALYALQGARMWLAPRQCKALVDRAARAGPERGRAGEGSGTLGDDDLMMTKAKRRGSGDSDMTLEQEDQLEMLSSGSWDYLEEEGRRMVRARIRYEGDARRSVLCACVR